MTQRIYFVGIDHVFFQDTKPIRFTSEADLQTKVEEALLNAPQDRSFRSYEFDNFDDAAKKFEEVKKGLYLKSDKGYSRPSEWYFLEFEVAWIEECETDSRGDFCDETQTPYAHPKIVFGPAKNE